MPTELKSSAVGPGEQALDNAAPQDRAAGGVTADLRLAREALGRIEAAARADREALDRLRGSLDAMARLIADAKSAYAVAGDSADTATLLDELEHLIDSAIETANGAAVVARATAAPAAAPQAVPTVAGVVSQLGSAVDATPPTQDDSRIVQEQDDAVSELKAALAAMRAATEDFAPPAEAELQAESEITPETKSEAEPAITGSPSSPPAAILGDGVLQENELLANFERMEAMPLLPPEEGAAVIFSRAAPQQPSHVVASSPLLPDNSLTEPAAEQPAKDDQPAPAAEASTPTSALPAASPPQATGGPSAVAPPAPPVVEPQAAPPAERPAAALAKPTAAAAVAPAVVPPEAEFDPSDFLFGPEPEPDPAAFLLEPAPRGVQTATPAPTPAAAAPSAPASMRDPQAGAATAPSAAKTGTASAPAVRAPSIVSAKLVALAKPAEIPVAATPVAPTAPATSADTTADTAPEPPPLAPDRDPLRALKAMNEHERLAMFS